MTLSKSAVHALVSCSELLGDLIYFCGDDERMEHPHIEDYVKEFGDYEARKIYNILKEIDKLVEELTK